MSGHKKRIDTIRAIILGSCIQNDPRATIIVGEFAAVVQASKVPSKRQRWILEILHSTRGADSALAAFIAQRPIAVPAGKKSPHSIGQYLALLTSHATPGIGKLAGGLRANFQTRVAKPRNKYMHQAGAFPNTDKEVRTLLSEIENCLAAVMQL